MFLLLRQFIFLAITVYLLGCLIGCGEDEPVSYKFPEERVEDESATSGLFEERVEDHFEEEAVPANFISATPPGGRIAANGTITVTFDNAPADVTVSAGTVTVAGKTATIAGPFTPGPFALTITWADGSQALNYTVIAPDTDPPAVTGGTVKHGDKDVDSEVINGDAKIEITFSEVVTGNIALQTEGGDDVGWLGKVEGNRATLEIVKGKEIANETTYVIAGRVSDAAGNSTKVRIIFVTRGKE